MCKTWGGGIPHFCHKFFSQSECKRLHAYHKKTFQTKVRRNSQLFITRSSKDECSTRSNNHLRSLDLFRSQVSELSGSKNLHDTAGRMGWERLSQVAGSLRATSVLIKRAVTQELLKMLVFLTNQQNPNPKQPNQNKNTHKGLVFNFGLPKAVFFWKISWDWPPHTPTGLSKILTFCKFSFTALLTPIF